MSDKETSPGGWGPEALMKAAIEKVRQGLTLGQSPFGCAIAINGRLVACEHNTVVATPDATAHAEVNAIRSACVAIGSHHLDGAVVATTCEPCPMCMSALHWARVAEVHYGATIEDAAAAGFNELHLSAARVLSEGGSQVKLISGLMRKDCQQLFQDWLADEQRSVY